MQISDIRIPSEAQGCIDYLHISYSNPNYHTLALDIVGHQAVPAAVAELLSWTNVPIDVVAISNIDVMHNPESTLSEDGIDAHLVTNHIGHYLFADLIMPKLMIAAETNPKGAPHYQCHISLDQGREPNRIRHQHLEEQRPT